MGVYKVKQQWYRENSDKTTNPTNDDLEINKKNNKIFIFKK